MAQHAPMLWLTLAYLFCAALTQEFGRCNYAQFKLDLEERISSHEDRQQWPARILRAGFHDCFAGGCDASIRFEVERPENTGIAPTLQFLEAVAFDSTGGCVNLADALKLGMEVALKLSGAPQVRCHNGQPSPMADSANGRNWLPFPNMEHREIIDRFNERGFTTREALAGNFGGHSLGSFADGFGGRFPFTPHVHRFGRNFARHASNILSDDPNFNLLPSDMKLAREEPHIVEEFGNVDGALGTAFSSFMRKMCSIDSNA